MGCYQVAVVILHVYKTWNWLLLNKIGYYEIMNEINQTEIIFSFLARAHSSEKRLLASPCTFICLCVCLSACVSAAPTGQIFVNFDNGDFFKNLSRKFKFG